MTDADQLATNDTRLASLDTTLHLTLHTTLHYTAHTILLLAHTRAHTHRQVQIDCRLLPSAPVLAQPNVSLATSPLLSILSSTISLKAQACQQRPSQPKTDTASHENHGQPTQARPPPYPRVHLFLGVITIHFRPYPQLSSTLPFKSTSPCPRRTSADGTTTDRARIPAPTRSPETHASRRPRATTEHTSAPILLELRSSQPTSIHSLLTPNFSLPSTVISAACQHQPKVRRRRSRRLRS